LNGRFAGVLGTEILSLRAPKRQTLPVLATLTPISRSGRRVFSTPRRLGCGAPVPKSSERRRANAFSTPDFATSDFATSDCSTSDCSTSDCSTSDFATSDCSTSDCSTPDRSTPDFATSDFATSDCSTPDFATSDCSTSDCSTPDFATPDFATPDCSTSDCSTTFSRRLLPRSLASSSPFSLFSLNFPFHSFFCANLVRKPLFRDDFLRQTPFESDSSAIFCFSSTFSRSFR